MWTGKCVIKIVVNKGTESPYYLAVKGLRPEGVFVRQGASSVPATESIIRKIIKETDGDSFENMRSLNQDLSFDAASKEFRDRKVSFEASQYKALKVSQTMSGCIIKYLVNKGILQAVGGGKNTRYIVVIK